MNFWLAFLLIEQFLHCKLLLGAGRRIPARGSHPPLRTKLCGSISAIGSMWASAETDLVIQDDMVSILWCLCVCCVCVLRSVDIVCDCMGDCVCVCDEDDLSAANLVCVCVEMQMGSDSVAFRKGDLVAFIKGEGHSY